VSTSGAPAPEGGNQPPPNLTSNRRLQQTQAQVDEVVDIMRVNVDKVLERDSKLSELDDRADALQAGASQFETSAAKLKNKYWWKNAKDLLRYLLSILILHVLMMALVAFLFYSYVISNVKTRCLQIEQINFNDIFCIVLIDDDYPGCDMCDYPHRHYW
uniref:V-SNARE coiled-coil homology domain-containing protein n=1 Tax=Periophthalmus magnuspinnatus TaxID=409849 RepID=A0A3B4AB35_9GOBI